MERFSLIPQMAINLKNRLFKSGLPERDFYSGLIGCGSFVRGAYIPVLNNPRTVVTCSGIYSKSHRSARIVKSLLRYKTKIFKSFEEMAKSGIKSVLITAPNYLHYNYILESLNNGLDIFCEKPLANTVEEILGLKKVLKESNNILMVGLSERYLDRFKRINYLLGSGMIGEITQVHAFHNQNISKYILNSEWLSDVAKSGGGVVHHAGIHLINILIYLFGKIDKVYAEFSNIKLPKSCGEDTAFCRFVFKSGVTATLEASCVNMVNSTFEHIIIKGNKGTIVSDALKSNIDIIKNNENNPQSFGCLIESTVDSIYNELAHFYDCVKNRKSPQTDIEDSLETMKVTQAIRFSAIERKEISIDEIYK